MQKKGVNDMITFNFNLYEFMAFIMIIAFIVIIAFIAGITLGFNEAMDEKERHKYGKAL